MKKKLFHFFELIILLQQRHLAGESINLDQLETLARTGEIPVIVNYSEEQLNLFDQRTIQGMEVFAFQIGTPIIHSKVLASLLKQDYHLFPSGDFQKGQEDLKVYAAELRTKTSGRKWSVKKTNFFPKVFLATVSEDPENKLGIDFFNYHVPPPYKRIQIPEFQLFTIKNSFLSSPGCFTEGTIILVKGKKSS